MPLKYVPPRVAYFIGCQDKQNQVITLTSISAESVRHWQRVMLGKGRRGWRYKQEGGKKSFITFRNKSKVSTSVWDAVLSMTFSSLCLPRALRKSLQLLHTRVEGFHWHISTRVLEMPESRLSRLMSFSDVHISADKGMSSEGRKNRGSCNASLQFVSLKKCSLSGDMLQQLEWVALPCPQFPFPSLAVTSNAPACSAFELLSSPLPSQRNTVHQYPVILQHPPGFGCITPWKNSCCLLSLSHQAVPFAFPFVEHLQVGCPPCKLPKC